MYTKTENKSLANIESCKDFGLNIKRNVLIDAVTIKVFFTENLEKQT